MSLTESGTSSVASAWDRYAVAYQHRVNAPLDVISYGPNVGTENDIRLLGPLAGKRVLDLGCGGGQNAIAAARQGAISIGVDVSVEQLAYARRLIEQEEVRVELKHGDLAELAFQRADSVDIVLSMFAFQYVPDLNRVFRQVHRVLKPQSMLVFSIPHPAGTVTGRPSSVMTQAADQLSLEPTPMAVARSYFEKTPMVDKYEEQTFTEYTHTMSDVFMGLIRSGYRVDAVVEPQPRDASLLPSGLVIRARKEA